MQDDTNQEEYTEHLVAPNGTVPDDVVAPTEFPQLVTSAVIVRAVGKKSGKPYVALRVKLINGYEKMYFFEQAEQFMVEAELDKLK